MSDNSVTFNGTFKSNSSVLKLNSVAFPGECGKQVRYDATLETKVFGFDTKITFKTPNYTALFDLGAFRWTKFVSGKERNCWFNPYLKINLDQTLKTNDVSLGLISTLDSKCMSVHQLNMTPGKASAGLSAQSYLQYKCCNYFASMFMKYDLMNFKSGTQEKKLRLGYQFDKAQMCFGVNQIQPSSWGKFCGEAFL